MISRVCAWLDLRDKNRLDRAECVDDPRMQGTRLASALWTVQSKLCSPTWPAGERDTGVYCTLKEQALSSQRESRDVTEVEKQGWETSMRANRRSSRVSGELVGDRLWQKR